MNEFYERVTRYRPLPIIVQKMQESRVDLNNNRSLFCHKPKNEQCRKQEMMIHKFTATLKLDNPQSKIQSKAKQSSCPH